MAPIGNLARDFSRNHLPEKSSQTDHIETGIPDEQQAAIGDIFDRWRLSKGWNLLPNDAQTANIANFVASLNRERVPYQHYSELYERFLRTQAQALSDGRTPPEWGAPALIAEWIGANGLKADLAKREVERGRTLTPTSQSNCLRCFGTGWEEIRNVDGQKLGVRKGCLHEYVDASDPHIGGIDKVIQAAKTPVHDTSAINIIRRLRGQVLVDHASEPEYGDRLDALAAAIRTLDRADRYLRGLEVEW